MCLCKQGGATRWSLRAQSGLHHFSVQEWPSWRSHTRLPYSHGCRRVLLLLALPLESYAPAACFACVPVAEACFVLSNLQAGVLADSKLVLVKVAMNSLLAVVALYNYAFAQKKKGH